MTFLPGSAASIVPFIAVGGGFGGCLRGELGFIGLPLGAVGSVTAGTVVASGTIVSSAMLGPIGCTVIVFSASFFLPLFLGGGLSVVRSSGVLVDDPSFILVTVVGMSGVSLTSFRTTVSASATIINKYCLHSHSNANISPKPLVLQNHTKIFLKTCTSFFISAHL